VVEKTASRLDPGEHLLAMPGKTIWWATGPVIGRRRGILKQPMTGAQPSQYFQERGISSM